MAHGRNNPTGNIGFSPLLITLFAPLAFMFKAWRAALATFVVVVVILLLWGWKCHMRDLASARKEQLEREARGF